MCMWQSDCYLCVLQVGLAVDDVKGIQQAAVLKRLELRVSYNYIN